MGDGIPNITLTNPFNKDQAPSPAQSPIKDGDNSSRWPELHATSPNSDGNNGGRPISPVSSWGRPDSANSSSWTSPIRLKRSLSNRIAAATSGSKQSEVTGASNAEDAQAGMDPLSLHLMKRTSTPMSPPGSRPRTADSSPSKGERTDSSPNKDERKSKSPSPAPRVRNPGPQRTDTSRTDTTDLPAKDLKKGVKAVSFLSKLMGGAKKRDEAPAVAPAEVLAAVGEERPEGNDATVFAEPMVDSMGFRPRHPQPPAYIKVRSKNKQRRDFDRLFLAQELQPASKRRKMERQPSKLRRRGSLAPSADHTIWAMEFSKDGKYLAAAGADMVVRVWAVLSSAEDRQKHEKQETAAESDANRTAHLSAPVFQDQPVREFEAHTATILDLSWSKNNFLLSSSMDKTVRLWHISRAECLCTFKHTDFVPSIAFHPKDDRFFLAGSLDSKLRLWSIPDKSVAYVAQVPDMITAVAFTPDGKFAMAGCFSGLVMFFETEGLRYQSQMHVRSSRGQNAKGSKITGLQASYNPEGSAGDILWLLVTSNDSRIRLYNFRDKSLELKLKGNENNCSQIRATLSECGKYVTCGSEDRKAYIWSLGSSKHDVENEKRDKHPMEFFEAHDSITTIVCVAPAKTRVHLGKSNDPVYDLCHPPPVTLMSRGERAESQASSRAPSIPPASLTPRSTHSEGNIIVTADFEGRIKVFRQDCAYSKRKVEDSDKSSIFGKRASVRSLGSLATKGSQRSLREGRPSSSTQGAGDRIMNWRQGVASTSTLANGAAARSASPGISSKAESVKTPPGQAGSLRNAAVGEGAPLAKTDTATSRTRSLSDAQKHLAENPLNIQNGQSMLYWDVNQVKERADRLKKNHEANGGHSNYAPLTPVMSRDEGESGLGQGTGYERNGHLGVRPSVTNGQMSYVSQLSDERSSDDDEVFDDAPEGRRLGNAQCPYCGTVAIAGFGENMSCKSCGRSPGR
ncbi:hypothetical protein LTR97_001467 [Elasticomyces elasticus]|uniref:WD40 repeat-like protein n=1 Tax=Elasticomyces elasticus TaxID=574655 RepID=A0AAN7ZQG4_9PEZI|nr:hypothetical protein LTR97_001467 [Elasticomyces elasticus]